MVIFVIVVYAQGPLTYCIEINIILSSLYKLYRLGAINIPCQVKDHRTSDSEELF